MESRIHKILIQLESHVDIRTTIAIFSTTRRRRVQQTGADQMSLTIVLIQRES